jgi:hypothetical protein
MMAYHVYPHEGRVEAYLRDSSGLSPAARDRLWRNLRADLGLNGDFYRGDPSRRLAPGSPYFWYHVLLHDTEGDGRYRDFWFVVNDAPAMYGVLTLEYVQEGIPTLYRDERL